MGMPGSPAPHGGRLMLVGIGPGSESELTVRAREALAGCEVVVGYVAYVEQIQSLVEGRRVVSTGMGTEVERAREAVRLARGGRRVAVVSGGDIGIYGMAGLVLQVLQNEGWRPEEGPLVEVLPGVSALSAGASLLGAPLMHDFAVVSLSDLLTRREEIETRLEAAARADFVVVLYNPASRKRRDLIERAREIFLRHRSPGTPVGLVTGAYRQEESVVLCTLEDMLSYQIGMSTTIFVGSSRSYAYAGLMITPRGVRCVRR